MKTTVMLLMLFVGRILCLGGEPEIFRTDAYQGTREWQEHIVARTIYAEGRGEGTNGMYAIACVIQQRVMQSHRRPATECLKPKAFSCWNKATEEDKQFKKIAYSRAFSYAKDLAAMIVSGDDLDRKIVGFANHYCTLDCNPGWAKGQNPVAVVGNHKFFKL